LFVVGLVQRGFGRQTLVVLGEQVFIACGEAVLGVAEDVFTLPI